MEDLSRILEIPSNRYIEMRFAGLPHTEAVIYMSMQDHHKDGTKWLTVNEIDDWTTPYVSDPYHALRGLERKGIVVSSEIRPYLFSAFSMCSNEFKRLARVYMEEKLEQMIRTIVTKLIWDEHMV